MPVMRFAAAFAVSDLLRAGFAFATSLIAARGLGIEGLGRWMLCMAWASTLVTVFDLGFGVLLTRTSARGDAGLGRALSQALAIRLALFAPVAMVLIAAAPLFAHHPDTVNGLRAGEALAAFGMLSGCFTAVFRGRADWLPASLAIEAAASALQCCAGWLALASGAGVVALLATYAAVQALQLAALVAMWRNVRPPAQPLEWPEVAILRGAIGCALPLALSGLVANLQLRLAPIALGALSTTSDVASFGVAWRLANLAKMLPHAAFAGVFPLFARQSLRPSGAEGDEIPGGNPETRLRARFEAAVIGFGVAAGIAIGLFAAPLVRITYGRQFEDAAGPLIWSGVWILPSLINGARRVYLIAHDRERIALQWCAAALAIQVAGCAALAPLFGASGAAAAMALGEAAVWWPLRQVTLDAGIARGVRLQADYAAVRVQADWASR
jgi:O-antigen/teichoic acid export membrane protein